MAHAEVDIFLRAASSQGAQIQRLPGLIAVFGGPISSSQERAAGMLPVSQRDAFVGWVNTHDTALGERLLLPENYDDWKEFNVYPDLLKFEEDLSHLTAAVLIFLEAPGAIAELGAFSQITALRERLIVVVGDQYHEKKSFISLGPLRQLDGYENDHVCVIPEAPASLLSVDLPVILRTLNSKIQAGKGGRAFDNKNRGHYFILALDLITLAEVITFADLKSVFAHFDLAANETAIRQILFTLVRAGLVQTHRYGGILYYLPVRRRDKWVDYRGHIPEEPFNRTRVAARMLSSRKLEDDRHRVHSLVFSKGELQ